MPVDRTTLRRALLPLCLAVSCVPGVAAAQSAGWDGRVRIAINGGIQTGSDTLTQSFSLQKNAKTGCDLVKDVPADSPAAVAAPQVTAATPVAAPAAAAAK